MTGWWWDVQSTILQRSSTLGTACNSRFRCVCCCYQVCETTRTLTTTADVMQIVDHRSGRELEESQRLLVTTPVRRAPEPVVRRMIPLTLAPPGPSLRNRFTVLTYNILADLYATQQAFPTSDPCALLWQYRRQLILQELALYDADIVCLQEVQSTSFHEDLRPEMDRRGFDAVFKKKTQVRPALHSSDTHCLSSPLACSQNICMACTVRALSWHRCLSQVSCVLGALKYDCGRHGHITGNQMVADCTAAYMSIPTKSSPFGPPNESVTFCPMAQQALPRRLSYTPPIR